MDDIILIISLGIIALLQLKAIIILARETQRIHKDVRRIIEVGFWSAKRELEAKRLLRQQKRVNERRFKASEK